MSKEEINRLIRSEKRSTESAEEQVLIEYRLWEENILPDHEGIKALEIEDELGLDLEYQARTSLKHLKDLNLVEEFFPPGPEILAIAEWRNDGEGEIVLGEVKEAAIEGLEALANEIEEESASEAVTVADGSGETVRKILASKFDLVPDKVENYLRTTDDPVDVLNEAVEAIEEAKGVSVSNGYGAIAFIHMPYRYRLTEKAVGIFEK